MDLTKENITLDNKKNLLKQINKKLFKNVNNNNLNNNIIIVYTPPKVASTSLISSLRLFLSHKFNIVHIHGSNMLSSLINMNIDGITIHDIIHYNKKLGKNVYVIDVFRNPVERKISEYFEQLSALHFNNTEENLKKYPIQKIVNRFNNIYPYIANEDYFMEKYNIPIPEFFDFEKKYLLVKHNDINYIKLRMDDIDSWNIILSDIFKTEIIIVKDYETKNKSIGDVYKKFKEYYKLPYCYYLLLNDCPLLKYYYNEDERKTYLDQWLEKIDHNTIKSYTEEEYNFYLNLCIENKYYNNFIQLNHYIDNGCLCEFCFNKRKEIINKLKKGVTINNEKIIHNSELIKREIIENNIRKNKLHFNEKQIYHNQKIKKIFNNIVFTKNG